MARTMSTIAIMTPIGNSSGAGVIHVTLSVELQAVWVSGVKT